MSGITQTPIESNTSSTRKSNASWQSMRTFTDLVSEQYQASPDVYLQLPFRAKDLNKWLLCFCVLNFNVDIGPEFECVFPRVNFSEHDLKTICFSSFPEQGYPDNTESFHTFRFKCTSDITLPIPSSNSRTSSYAARAERYLYGYVLFQQHRDRSKIRNYSQQSIAIISPFEFPALFESCVRRIAPYVFEPSLMFPTLQSTCRNVASWPDPEALLAKTSAGSKRKRIDLPYLGDKIRVILAQDPSLPLTEFTDSNKDVTLFGKPGSWGELLKSLKDLSQLFTLFEIIILGQSLAVSSSTPSMCSNFIEHLVDLIKPIPYVGLVREYITMHSDIEALNIISQHPVPGVIGFTNPFLSQMVRECGGSVYLLDITTKNKPSPPSINVRLMPILPDVMPISATPLSMTFDLLYPVTSTIEWQRKSIKNALSTIGLGPHADAENGRLTYLTRDKQFLKKLRGMMDRQVSSSEIDKFIRIYFANLTAKILAPIKRFLFVAQVSPRQLSYAEFMFYHSSKTLGARSVNIHKQKRATDSGYILSLIHSLGSQQAKEDDLDKTTETASVINTAVPNEQHTFSELYSEAVRPEKGVFHDHNASEKFYGLLLRSGNFEAWSYK
ncbi:hypothetical protein V1514DRAFT_329305 [Lipomyces japonicus]|uniref:uncharacterized protein n=1 Tax=Lipomyces japonicus TaxID=56871 RepID=UPI0034CF478B